MGIPKIIHQIWMQGYKKMPFRHKRWTKSWRKKNRDWQYRFWDETAIISLIEEHIPELLPSYSNFDCVVARSDIGRYVILSVYGGLYADTDTICIKPIEDIVDLEHYTIITNVHDMLDVDHTIEQKLEQVTNSVIFCQPKHPVIQDILQRISRYEDDGQFWINITGPPMLSKCVTQYFNATQDVLLLNHKYIISAYYYPTVYLRYIVTRRYPKQFAIHFNCSARKLREMINWWR